MMTDRERDNHNTEPPGLTVFITAASLFVAVSLLLFLGAVALAASPLLFLFYVGLLILTIGTAYYYGRGRWY